MARTLLEAVNDVLLQVGERPSSSLTNPVSRKAFLAIEAALNDINTANDWVFKKLAVPITQRTQERHTVPGLERLDRLHYRSPTTLRETLLRPMAPSELYGAYEVKAGIPEAYALVDDETIAVLPYPEELSVIIVYGTKSILIPQGRDDLVDLPDRFYSLLLTRALYHMLATHLSDNAAASLKDQEFVVRVRQMIKKEAATTRQGRNLYRRRG
jgi:hypothetical protein